MRRNLLRLFALFAVLALVAAACTTDDDEEADGDGGDGETTTPEVTVEVAVLDTVTGITAAGDPPEGITPEPGDDRGNVDGTLVLGSVLPSTGDLGVLGEPMNQAVAMAIRDINAAGGALGGDVELIAEDSGTNEDVANTAVDKLIGPDAVDAVIGAASSRISLSIIDKVTGAGVVQCSPSNTGVDFTTYADGGYYFRTAPPDNLQGQVVADLVATDEHTTVAIMNLADAYGQGFADALAESLTAAGIEVVASVPYDPQGTNFDADVDEVAAADPEAVVLIAFPETGSVIIQSMIEKGVGPSDVAHYYTDGLQSGDLPGLVDPENPAVLVGVRGTAPSAAPPGGAEFFPEAFAEFAPGVDTIFSAHAYDCTIATALAAVQGESDDSTVIAENMISVTSEGEKCTTFEECSTMLADGADIDYDGASGPLDFNPAGEPAVGDYDTWEFQEAVADDEGDADEEEEE